LRRIKSNSNPGAKWRAKDIKSNILIFFICFLCSKKKTKQNDILAFLLLKCYFYISCKYAKSTFIAIVFSFVIVFFSPLIIFKFIFFQFAFNEIILVSWSMSLVWRVHLGWLRLFFLIELFLISSFNIRLIENHWSCLDSLSRPSYIRLLK